MKSMIFKTKFSPTLLSTLLLTVFTGTVKAEVVSSIHPIGMITAAITDGVVQHNVLSPSNVSPHDYALRPNDIKHLREADLVVWIGKDMEIFLEKPLSSIEKSKQLNLSELPEIARLIHTKDNTENASANNLNNEHNHEHENEHNHEHENKHNHEHDHSTDYHIWMSVDIAEAAASAIGDKLIQMHPEHTQKIKQNLETFKQNLAQTDSDIKSKLAGAKGKKFYVFHDAYGYFEHRYELSKIGHFAINPTILPGAKKLSEIKETLAKDSIECVFSEPQFIPDVVNAVIQGTKVKTATLDPVASDIPLSATSYFEFLDKLSNQYLACLR